MPVEACQLRTKRSTNSMAKKGICTIKITTHQRRQFSIFDQRRIKPSRARPHSSHKTQLNQPLPQSIKRENQLRKVLLNSGPPTSPPLPVITPARRSEVASL